MAKKKKKYEIVIVIWCDASNEGDEWENIDEVKEEFENSHMCITSGILLHKGRTQLVLAKTIDFEQEQINARFKIPRKMVEKIIKIGTVESFIKERNKECTSTS